MLRPEVASRQAKTVGFDPFRWPAKSYQILRASKKAIAHRMPTYQCKPHSDWRLVAPISVKCGRISLFCRIDASEGR